MKLLNKTYSSGALDTLLSLPTAQFLFLQVLMCQARPGQVSWEDCLWVTEFDVAQLVTRGLVQTEPLQVTLRGSRGMEALLEMQSAVVQGFRQQPPPVAPCPPPVASPTH